MDHVSGLRVLFIANEDTAPLTQLKAGGSTSGSRRLPGSKARSVSRLRPVTNSGPQTLRKCFIAVRDSSLK